MKQILCAGIIPLLLVQRDSASVRLSKCSPQKELLAQTDWIPENALQITQRMGKH